MEQAYYGNSSALAETFQRYGPLDTDEPVIGIVNKEMRFEALTSETLRRGVRGEPFGSSEQHANLDWIAPLLAAVSSRTSSSSAWTGSWMASSGASKRVLFARQRLRPNLPLKSPITERELGTRARSLTSD